jgi:hypothetical protein
MATCRSLLEAAQGNPAGVRFTELCQLAECFGWEFARQKGDHRLYKRSGTKQLMNFQDSDGKAKVYQVRQLLAVIDDLGLELK